MSLCSYCGQTISETGGLCAHHGYGQDSDWAIENRIMCDFIHRGIVVPGGRERRLVLDELEVAA